MQNISRDNQSVSKTEIFTDSNNIAYSIAQNNLK